MANGNGGKKIRDYGLVKRLSEQGLSHEHIAEVLEIAPLDWAALMRNDKRLSDALAEGRATPVRQIEQSMFRRAVGFQYEEVDETVNGATGLLVERKRRVRHFIGSDTAGIFLLKNWDPQRYRDEFHVSMTLRDRMMRGKTTGADQTKGDGG